MEDTCEVNPASDSQNPTYVVVAVQGTFEAKLTWALPDSRLCSELKKHLHSQVMFCPYSWSGKNSERKREITAQPFREFLRGKLVDYPDAMHFVVCHSHGGNMALQAIAAPDLRERIRIVALSVPFIHIEPRFGPFADETFLVCAFVIFNGLLAFGMVGAAQSLGFHFPRLLTFAIIAALLFLPVPQIIDKLVAQSGLFWQASVERHSFDGNMLILRESGDEAAGILTGSYFSGWFWRKIFGLSLAPLKSWYMGILFGIPMVLAFPLMILSLLTLWPFGWDLAMVATILELSIEPSLVGLHKFPICTLMPFRLNDKEGIDFKALHHGLHNNPFAIKLAADWMFHQRFELD